MSNWSILNFFTDPTPGDVGAVETMASTYTRHGQTFSDLADFISAIGDNPDMVGEYAEKFASEITPLISEFRLFSESFEEVGNALKGWAGELPGFQQVSLSCLQRAEAAEANRVLFDGLVSSQKGVVRSAKSEARRASDDEQSGADRRLSAAESTLANYEEKLTEAIDELEAARQEAHRNHGEYESTASRYADTVDAAQDHAPQISWWETVYYSDAWEVIVQIAVVVAIAATIAGFFFGGWVLPLIGLATSLLVYSDDLMGFFAGDRSGWELALSTVFLALSGLGNFGKIADGFASHGRAFWNASRGVYGPITRFRLAASTYGQNGARALEWKGLANGLRDLARPGLFKWKDLKDGANLINAARSLPAAQRNGEFLMGIGKISGVFSKSKPFVQDLLSGSLGWNTLFRQVPAYGEGEKAVDWVRGLTNNSSGTPSGSDLSTVLRHFTTAPAPGLDSPSGAVQPGMSVPHGPHPLFDLQFPLNPDDFIVTPPSDTNIDTPGGSDTPSPAQQAPSSEGPTSTPEPSQPAPTSAPTVPETSPSVSAPAPNASVQEPSAPNSSSSGSDIELELPDLEIPAANEASPQPPADINGGTPDLGQDGAPDIPPASDAIEDSEAGNPSANEATPATPGANEGSVSETTVPETEMPAAQADQTEIPATSPETTDTATESPEQSESDPTYETVTPVEPDPAHGTDATPETSAPTQPAPEPETSTPGQVDNDGLVPNAEATESEQAETDPAQVSDNPAPTDESENTTSSASETSVPSSLLPESSTEQAPLPPQEGTNNTGSAQHPGASDIDQTQTAPTHNVGTAENHNEGTELESDTAVSQAGLDSAMPMPSDPSPEDAGEQLNVTVQLSGVAVGSETSPLSSAEAAVTFTTQDAAIASSSMPAEEPTVETTGLDVNFSGQQGMVEIESTTSAPESRDDNPSTSAVLRGGGGSTSASAVPALEDEEHDNLRLRIDIEHNSQNPELMNSH